VGRFGVAQPLDQRVLQGRSRMIGRESDAHRRRIARAAVARRNDPWSPRNA
jgi:hypothetical protein